MIYKVLKITDKNIVTLKVTHNGTGTFYFNDGSISFTITFRNNVYAFPEGTLITTVSNASGAYFSLIGNPMTIEVNNTTFKRLITVKD